MTNLELVGPTEQDCNPATWMNFPFGVYELGVGGFVQHDSATDILPFFS